MAERRLHFKETEPLLDDHHEVSDLAVCTTRQSLVQQGGYPEGSEPLRRMGRVCEFALPLDQRTNRPVCL